MIDQDDRITAIGGELRVILWNGVLNWVALVGEDKHEHKVMHKVGSKLIAAAGAVAICDSGREVQKQKTGRWAGWWVYRFDIGNPVQLLADEQERIIGYQLPDDLRTPGGGKLAPCQLEHIGNYA